MITEQQATPTKFRAQPVEIEALQIVNAVESLNVALAWIGHHGGTARRAHNARPDLGLIVVNPEGDMLARPGDWVIRDAQGEFRTCQPELFAKSYLTYEGPELDPAILPADIDLRAGISVISIASGRPAKVRPSVSLDGGPAVQIIVDLDGFEVSLSTPLHRLLDGLEYLADQALAVSAELGDL
ncbi:hypothetical protein [Gordonia sp. NB41Y]|uniref:hypothetical protein n=1 Tax=Gordonia sp. NB41Y TaxID=875808 RepID=UPI0002BFD5C4|nr:hypothetical protein [Gordonia sp. NB41Y]EMP15050.1 hypothetical protein ISGA_45 [Gordonia sp. NB41Y]WLP91337.1 hypothetical protein Q9K23_03435 [Gordonia sp. NB41Y]